MEAGAVGIRLRPKENTSVSCEDSCWRNGFLWICCWDLFQLLQDFFVFPNIFLARSSSENVLNVGLEYGYLSCKYVVFSWFSLIYA